MRRRDLLFGSLCGAVASRAADGPPNILLINTDDQRFDTIRALGNNEIQTPALDSLVRRGFVFTNLYSQGGLVGAMCLPSRTMLMTGRTVFHIPERNVPVPAGMTVLAKAFESAGYRTFHYGKRGNTYVAASEAFQTKLYSKEGFDVRAEQPEQHANQVIEWVRASGNGPFFIYMAPPVPHDPRSAPKKFVEMYDPAKITLPKNYMPEHPFDNGDLKIRDELLAGFPRTREEMRKHLADYYATITCLDHHIGRILAVLPANTIVLFTSDQGLAVGGRHGLMGKQNLYEHFKSPCIVAGPGIKHGKSEALAHMHDLFPTLCDLARVPIPASVEGKSLAPIIRGEKREVREYAFAVYKDVQRMVRRENWKLIWYPKVGKFQLFDVVRDPWELNDRSGDPAQASRLAELKRRMAEQQDKHDDKYAPRPV
ncbi:MAG: sulfatase-like hydrolase/transferase [Bryobacteraceae bacterium]